MKALALIPLLLLAGCQTTQVIAVGCAQIIPHSKAWQNELADEVEALPKNARLGEVFDEYVSLRDQARACRNASK